MERSLFYFNQQLKQNPFHTDSYYFIGKIYFLQKLYTTACKFFEICHTREPENPWYNFYLGKSLLTIKQPSNAVQFLKVFARHRPYGYLYLGLAYYNLCNYEKSIACFKKCPDTISRQRLFKIAYSASLFNIGNLYYAEGKLAEAEQAFESSISLFPDAHPSRFQLGSVYLNRKEYERARLCFEALFSDFPANESLQMTLAHIYNQTGDTARLEQFINEILQKNISTSLSPREFKKILAYTLYRGEKFKEAIPLFLQLYRMKYYDEYTLYYLSRCRYNTGEFQKALNAYDLIFSITESNIMINNHYCLMLIEQNRYEEATEKLVVFINGNHADEKTMLYYFYASVFSHDCPDFLGLYNSLKDHFAEHPLFIEAAATYFVENNQLEDALTCFYHLYTLLPDDDHTLVQLIDIFQKRNLNKQALFYTQKMHETRPGNHNAAFYYAFFLMKEGFLQKALDILGVIDKDLSKVNYLIAEIYFRMGKQSPGFTHLKASFLADPLYLPVQFKSLLYFYRQGSFRQALRICTLIEYSHASFHRVLVYQAIVYARRERYDLAVNRLEKYMIRTRPNHSPYIEFMLVVFLYNSGNLASCRSRLKKLITRRGQKAPYVSMLALLCRRTFDEKTLARITTHMQEHHPASPSWREFRERYGTPGKSRDIIRNDLGIRIP
jgi:tetratricopeptide (TPR) repeat protein